MITSVSDPGNNKPLHPLELERLVQERTQDLRKQLAEYQHTIAGLLENEQRYRIVSEMTTDYIFLVDVVQGGKLQLRWASENMMRLTGRTVKDAEMMDSWSSIIHPEDTDLFYSFIQRLFASGEPGVVECRSFIKSGDQRWIQINAHPRKDENGEVTSFVGAIKDISERKQAEAEICRLNEELEQRVVARTAQLQAANQELEAFTYSVSHDLRAPLRFIDGYTRILLEEYTTGLDSEGKNICDIIRGQSQRMSRLLDDLLSLSRMGRSEMHITSLNMSAMVDAIYGELTSSEDRQRIEFTVLDLPPVEGDAMLMHQVWVNLLQNAIKFSSKVQRAIIEVGSVPGENEIIYYVRDNGAGFDVEQAGRLFGVFQRLHAAEDFEGTGVGLAIVQRIIQRHGGRVWADSARDQGAVFFFALPRYSSNCH